jgi:hypothetical protein
MIFTARLLTPLAVILFFTGCGQVASTKPESVAARSEAHALSAPPPAEALRPSPNRLVGRILSIDETRRFAILDLRPEAPPAALISGAELIARTDSLVETGRLKTSRYVRTRTLGTQIVSGQPKPGDEVVFRLPNSD